MSGRGKKTRKYAAEMIQQNRQKAAAAGTGTHRDKQSERESERGREKDRESERASQLASASC